MSEVSIPLQVSSPYVSSSLLLRWFDAQYEYSKSMYHILIVSHIEGVGRVAVLDDFHFHFHLRLHCLTSLHQGIR